MEEAVRRFYAAMSENRGIMLLVGPAGIGKTFLVKLISDQLRSRNVRVAQMITPRLTPDGFALEIGRKLKELRPAQSGESADEQSAAPPPQNGRPGVLIIDEAQTIADPDTFEVLRALLNHDHNGRFILTTLISGDDCLVERLRGMPSLNQRIGVRCRLEPLTLEETAAYIDFRLSAAGAHNEIFSGDAKEDVHTISEGIPRIVNTLCDLSMIIGADERLLRIDTEIIARARRELSSLR
jgi:type II secretory pathway predicted ATPase ExeA